MKRIALIFVLLITQSCSWLESDYDKLINPIRKLKLAERKVGKANPVFGGVIEPNFPDEKENNRTLEGVDSNHDGVRDDIEIWINRMAEDEYVRWAMRDYYRKTFETFRAVALKLPESEVHRTMAEASDSGQCLSWMQKPYSKEFTKKYNRDSREMTSAKIDDLFPNSSLRMKAYSSWNSYQIKGALGGLAGKYCEESKVGNRYRELVEKYQEHRKW